MRSHVLLTNKKWPVTLQKVSQNRDLLPLYNATLQRKLYHNCSLAGPSVNIRKRHIGRTALAATYSQNLRHELLLSNISLHQKRLLDAGKRIGPWFRSLSIYSDSNIEKDERVKEESSDFDHRLFELKTETQSYINDENPSATKAKSLIELWSKPYNSNYHESNECVKKILEHVLKHTIPPSNLRETVLALSSLLNHVLQMFVKKGDIQSSIYCFQQGKHYADTATFDIILNMCASFQLAQEAEDILLEMTKNASQINSSTNQPIVTPNTKSFNLVLKAQRLPHRAQNILERMITLWKLDGHDNIKPDIVSFNTVMNGYAKWSDDHKPALAKNKSTAKRSENIKEVVQILEKEMAETDVQPNVTTYNILLHAHAMDGDHHLAEKLFQEMIESENLVDPDSISFATCIHALVKNGQLDKAERMLNNSKFVKNDIYPSTFGYNSIIRGLCNSNNPERAEHIFDSMKASPDLDTFNILIDAYCMQNKPSSAHRILDQLEDKSMKGHSLQPNSFSYNSVIAAYSNTGQPERALSILRRMEKQYQDGNVNVLPDTISYNVVLSGYVKKQPPISQNSAIKVQNLLMHMKQLYRDGNKAIKPDIISYTTVMKAWVVSKHKDAFYKVNSILSKLELLEDQQEEGEAREVTLDAAVYNVYLNALSNQMMVHNERTKKDVTDLAFGVLNRMLSRSKTHNNPAIKPNIITYNTILNILVKHHQAERAYDMLIEMEKATPSSEGERTIKPNVTSYNTVLDGFARAGDGKKAKELLEKMAHLSNNNAATDGDSYVRPSVRSFNAVISAFAMKGDAKNAEQIFHVMKDLYQTARLENDTDGRNLIKPDKRTYTALINAYAKSGDPNSYMKIQILLNEMKDEWNLSPDTICLNTVINAISRSREPRKARQAMDILDQMESVKPDTATLNSILNACAFTSRKDDKREALTIVLDIMEEMFSKNKKEPSVFSDVRLDEITFGTMIKACHNLMKGSHNEKRKLLKTIFLKATQDGQVGPFVWKELNYALYENEIPSFLEQISKYKDVENWANKSFGSTDSKSNDTGVQEVSLNDLPNSWKRNARSR